MRDEEKRCNSGGPRHGIHVDIGAHLQGPSLCFPLAETTGRRWSSRNANRDGLIKATRRPSRISPCGPHGVPCMWGPFVKVIEAMEKGDDPWGAFRSWASGRIEGS